MYVGAFRSYGGGGGGWVEGVGARAGFPLSAVRMVPGDASSVFRRDTEAFSGAPGSAGAAPACIDLSELLL